MFRSSLHSNVGMEFSSLQNGCTALVWAADKHHVSVVEELLRTQGIDVNAASSTVSVDPHMRARII